MVVCNERLRRLRGKQPAWLRRFEFFLWVFMLVLYFVPKGIGQGQYELYPLLVLHVLLLLYLVILRHKYDSWDDPDAIMLAISDTLVPARGSVFSNHGGGTRRNEWERRRPGCLLTVSPESAAGCSNR